jgi:hypothetical protein
MKDVIEFPGTDQLARIAEVQADQAAAEHISHPWFFRLAEFFGCGNATKLRLEHR